MNPKPAQRGMQATKASTVNGAQLQLQAGARGGGLVEADLFMMFLDYVALLRWRADWAPPLRTR